MPGKGACVSSCHTLLMGLCQALVLHFPFVPGLSLVPSQLLGCVCGVRVRVCVLMLRMFVTCGNRTSYRHCSHALSHALVSF